MLANNTSAIIDPFLLSKSISDILNQVTQNFLDYLPLIFPILGLIGFIGNLFTYLQPELRVNTCCIYSLCGSFIDIIHLFLNLFPYYLQAKYGISIPWSISSALCKLTIFILSFFPHLSINFLLMAIIDRFAATCSLTSPIRRLNNHKIVPLMIIIAILTSGLVSLDGPINFETGGYRCVSQQPNISNVLYIILIGLMQPIVMLIFVLLTYRNISQSRRRVGGVTGTNTNQPRTQFIVMIFAQIVTTAFFSLQFTVMYAYFTFTIDEMRNGEQLAIIFFVFTVTRDCYFLNNVKSFYVSMLTSRLLRKTFIKGLMELLPRHLRPRLHVSQTNLSMATATRMRRGDAEQR